MQYLQKSFTVGPPEKFTCCEYCVYRTGRHSEDCVEMQKWRDAIQGKRPLPVIDFVDGKGIVWR